MWVSSFFGLNGIQKSHSFGGPVDPYLDLVAFVEAVT